VPIIVTCECGKQFQTSDANAGGRSQCPACGRDLIIPKAEFDPDATTPPILEEFTPRTSGKAIASLVLGILSLFCTFFTGLPAIILGALGLSEIGKMPSVVRGKGMAIAGIVLGAVGSTLSIIAILFALLLPAVQAAREAARRAQCIDNLKQMGLAFHNFHSANGHFPPAAITDANGKPLLSWRVAILPYIEQETLYRQFKLNEPWDSPINSALIAQMPNIYLCPSEPPGDKTMATYQVIVGPGTMFPDGEGMSIRKITDGTSNTLLVVEAKAPVPWTKPDDVEIREATTALGSKHPGGFDALFADGSVRFLRYSINPAILNALITPAGGEVVSSDSF
jgi:prepilin-type processing-associated H-X9-DG protein